MTSSILAATSLMSFAFLAQRLFAEEARVFLIAFISVGAMVTTCIGSWASQPAVTRLVTRRLSSR
ncbi:hypothetical protein SAMN05421748_126138 [Paractinoplanes atraurantiacus]|uniref:Uncharacterized protein n=1 Tax=Paractinoplanes atraurantiacus TaxID=1036182 RepID=A0A285JVT3_9ACTN|nr:hypothetical protein SAMN05421748_126138 [Actinoplanes atraurantiacus]